MNQYIEFIKARRSVRSYLDRPVSREILADIADCARLAPSARNRQMWRFTVVDRKESIEGLAADLGEKLGNPGYDFYRPAALILCSADRDNSFAIEDCACAMTTIFFAAEAYGLGSCWINQFKGMCDDPDIRAALRKIGLDDNQLIFGCAAIGYPSEDLPPRAEKRTDTVVFAD